MVQYTQTNERSKGREPWSSGFGKRLTFQRLWVRIPAPYTGWTFFTYICCKNCNDVCLKRPKINEKEARVGPFKKIYILALLLLYLLLTCTL